MKDATLAAITFFVVLVLISRGMAEISAAILGTKKSAQAKINRLQHYMSDVQTEPRLDFLYRAVDAVFGLTYFYAIKLLLWP